MTAVLGNPQVPWKLVICTNKIGFRKNGCSTKYGCEVLDVQNRVTVRAVTLLSALKSAHGRQSPDDFLGTMCRDAQLLDEGQMMPSCRMCSNS